MNSLSRPSILLLAILMNMFLAGISHGFESGMNSPPTKALDLGSGVKMELVLVPAGKFVMGSIARKEPESKRFGQVIMGVGVAVALALLIAVKRRAIAKRQRPRYSLLGLLCFVFAVNVMLYGAFRWRNASLAWADYESYRERLCLSDTPAHQVTLTQSFYMGKFPVTQAQYQQVMGVNPSSTNGSNNPVDLVSWNDAQDFCKRLSSQSKQVVRLPTEAEWEYACKAGSGNANDLADDDPEWSRYKDCGFDEHCRRCKRSVSTCPVGQKERNAFGLYDMLGCIGQWCEDSYQAYSDSPVEDPHFIEDEGYHVIRSGYHSMRTTSRENNLPFCSDKVTGFRVVLTARAPEQAK